MATEKSTSADRPEPKKFSTQEDLANALKNLQSISDRLQSEGEYILFLALLSFCSLIGVIASRPYMGTFPNVILGAGILCPIFGLAELFMWDRRTAQGMMLFEEISDEVEWQHRSFVQQRYDNTGKDRPDLAVDSESQPSVHERPNLDVRIKLRHFLRASSLPLARGQFGSAAYALYFVACIVFAAIFRFL